MKRNILFVIENSIWGGGEQAFSRIINGLNKSKYDVYAACLPPTAGTTSGEFANAIQDSAQIVPFDLRNPFNLWNIVKLAKIIQEKKIDLVHSQGARADFFSRAATWRAKTPCMVSTITAPVEEFDVCPLKKNAYVALDRCSEKRVDRFIVVADHLKEKLIQRHKIPSRKIVRIYNGIDAENIAYDPKAAASARKELAIAEKTPVVGAIGRLTWEKGLPYFIEAAKRVTGSADPPVEKPKFLIVGGGQLEDALRKQVKTLEMEEWVEVTGFVDNVLDIFCALDILVVPSLREGAPLVILEAMAMGKPVVASDIEGVRECVVDGTTGTLVPPKDPIALAAAITALLDDRPKAARMGAAGRKMALEEFSIINTIEKHDRLYEELIECAG